MPMISAPTHTTRLQFEDVFLHASDLLIESDEFAIDPTQEMSACVRVRGEHGGAAIG
jgi:hypothetical protein